MKTKKVRRRTDEEKALIESGNMLSMKMKTNEKEDCGFDVAVFLIEIVASFVFGFHLETWGGN